ncbi:MAG: glycosyltransferase family 2 protein [Aureispira sp.]
MLSLLVPCYNFDVRSLIQELHEQAIACSIAFEIICLEDASEASFVVLNNTLSELPHVQYEVLAKNVGRSKIRNLLAERAQYPFLLFMDCDAWPPNKDYIQRYVQALDQNAILYGGRCYKKEAPSSSTLYFHWYYGTQREEQTKEQRQQAPYHSFMTNNFLIPKALFLPIGFEEQLTSYGHEDTLFGLELAQRQHPIIHLDNPLEHVGLEPVTVFLGKSEQALHNLWYLYQKKLLPPNSTKLLTWYNKLKEYHLSPFLRLFHLLFHRLLLQQLQSKRPFLLFFDLYKLCYLAYLEKYTPSNIS